MRRLILGALAALFLFSLPVAAMAAAGTAKGVNPDADATAAKATRTLTVGSDINIGDVIKTGPNGQVEILFADSTKLVVGPNSHLEIQDYLVRNNGTAGKFAVDMLAGTFRFVTGTSPKPSYLITTPTGTIGVRGTAFDVYVDDKGVAHIMMYKSTSIMCEQHAKLCKDLSDLCEIGQIDSSEASIIGNANDLTGEQRDLIKTYFLYAMDESTLDGAFRIPHAFDCLHASPGVEPQPGLGTTGFGSDCGSPGYLAFGSESFGPTTQGYCGE
jgi:FecR protein